MVADRSPHRTFHHVETWIFDLDNTLYPHHVNLWEQVDGRIRDYIADFLKVDREEAFRLQKDYYRRYGTSMRGLMTEHGMKPDGFLEFVHEVDHSPLEPNPALGTAIKKLSAQTYDRFLNRHNIDARQAAMFEDLARNLAVPHARGMTTVLVVPQDTKEVSREAWELEGRDALHVDHVTDDLSGFLERF